MLITVLGSGAGVAHRSNSYYRNNSSVVVLWKSHLIRSAKVKRTQVIHLGDTCLAIKYVAICDHLAVCTWYPSCTRCFLVAPHPLPSTPAHPEGRQYPKTGQILGPKDISKKQWRRSNSISVLLKTSRCFNSGERGHRNNEKSLAVFPSQVLRHCWKFIN